MERYFGDLKQYFGELILCFLVCSGLSAIVFAGYEMSDPWSGNIFAATCASFLAMALLFAAHFVKLGIRVSAVITAVIPAGLAAALYYTGAFSGARSVDENPILFWVIVILSALAVFWSARSRLGLIFLFLAGSFLAAAFDFLQYPVSVSGYLVMMSGIAALFLYRVQNRTPSRLGADDNGIGNSKSGAYFFQSVAIALLATLLASGIYYGAVKPLNPSADRAALAQKLMSVKLLEELGISSKRVVIAEKPEDTVQAPPQRPVEYRQEQENRGSVEPKSSSGGWLGDHGNLAEVLAITYQKYGGGIRAAAAGSVLLLILAFPLKLLLRRKWYGDLMNQSNEARAVELYFFFVGKLKKAGLKKPESLTLLEYAADFKEELDQFSVYGADFHRLTQIYLKVIYGYQRISDEEWELFQDFYTEFYKNLRTEMGTLRYCLRFFTI